VTRRNTGHDARESGLLNRLGPASSSGETAREAAYRRGHRPASPAAEARRREQRARNLKIAAAVLVLVVLVGVVAGYAWWRGKAAWFEQRSRATNSAVSGLLTKPRTPGKPFFMVLMGEDKRPGEQVGNADTLMVAYVDPPKKHVALMSIPRDTRVQIPGHGTQKINAAALIGGAPLVIKTVKSFTGLPISHYAIIDFNGFKELVDAIGGVTVNVPVRITDAKAAGHMPGGLIEPGVQKLDGIHALTFVRSRHFADGDFTRIKDQQLFLKALAQQTMQVGNVVNAPKIADAVISNVVSDMKADELMDLAGDFRGMGSGGVEGATVPGEPKYIGGISYIIPDKVKLAAMVARVQAGQSLVQTSTVAPTATTVLPSGVTVTVRNGSGMTGLGAQCTGFLKAAGFRVTPATTAPAVYGTTIIVFKTDATQPKATLVHDRLAFGNVVQTQSLYQFKTDVLIVVGKDWKTHFPNGPGKP
jgi:polyisoprenyl-teichoic acid--peptidoglycan teichoic acid transferase